MLTFQTAKDPAQKASREENLLRALEQRRIMTLIVEVASSCNLKCTFCDAHSGRAPKFRENAGLMKPDTWATVLATIQDYCALRGPLEMMQFYGNGEPLLNKKLPAMVAQVVAAGIARKTRVITNGVLLTPEKLTELADAGLDEIHISLDTIDQGRYLDIKKSDEAGRVVENVQACIPVIEARGDVQLFIKYFTRESSNAYGLVPEDSDSVRQTFLAACENSNFVHLKEMPLVDVGVGMLNDKQDFSSPCEIPFYLLYIMHNGKVSACCSDVFNGMTVGRLVETSVPPLAPSLVPAKPAAVSTLTQIVDSAALHDIRKKHLEGRCNEIKLCAGCGNRTQVDLSQFSDETIGAIQSWIAPPAEEPAFSA